MIISIMNATVAIKSILVCIVGILAVSTIRLLDANRRRLHVHDISVPYSSSLVAFDGDEGIGSGWMVHLSRVADGDDFTTSRISLNSHYGTHVDAFRHIAPRGSAYDNRGAGVGDDIDSLDLYVLMGDVLVVDVGDADVIDADVLGSLDIPSSAERVLFKTRNSSNRLMYTTAFEKGYVALDDSGAEFIVARTGIKVRPQTGPCACHKWR